jgi:hypothetical protein
METFAEKAIKNGRGSRSIEASVMKTQSDFYRIRHSIVGPISQIDVM